MKNLKKHHKSQFDLTTGALQPEEAALQLKPSQTLHTLASFLCLIFALFLPLSPLKVLCHLHILGVIRKDEKYRCLICILLTVAFRDLTKLALIFCCYIPLLTCTLPFIPLKWCFIFKLSCLNFMESGKADWSLWKSLFNTLLLFVVSSFYPKHTRTGWWFMVQRPNGPMWQINSAHLLRTFPMSVSFRRGCS